MVEYPSQAVSFRNVEDNINSSSTLKAMVSLPMKIEDKKKQILEAR